MANRQRAVSLSLDWDNMVKKGEDSEKEDRKHLAAGVVEYDKETMKFCTGSMYTGKWNALGMSGYGTYMYPYGCDCEYEGSFEDGMFHGEGTLLYPMGQKLQVIFEKGKMIAYKFFHIDGLEYEEPWEYCVMPDRRFNVSIREGLQPPGREFITNQQPEKKMKAECYDTCDGIYQPATRCITTVRDPGDFAHLEEMGSMDEVEGDDLWIRGITIVSEKKHKWITHSCRKAFDEVVGYRPEFYEDWISGRQKEVEALEKKCKKSKRSFGSREFFHSRYRFDSNVDTLYAGTGRKLVLNP